MESTENSLIEVSGITYDGESSTIKRIFGQRHRDAHPLSVRHEGELIWTDELIAQYPRGYDAWYRQKTYDMRKAKRLALRETRREQDVDTLSVSPHVRRMPGSPTHGKTRVTNKLGNGRSGLTSHTTVQGQRGLVVNKGVGMPHAFATRLRFSYIFADSVGAYNDEIIRGNSPYDPVYATGGGQPQFFDELAAVYENYICDRLDWRVTFIQATGSGEGSYVVVGAYPLISASTTTDIETAVEFPHAKYGNLGPNTGGDGVVTVSGSMSTSQMYGVLPIFTDNEQDYAAVISDNPLNQWFLHIFYGTVDSSTAVGIKVNIELEYHTKFYGVTNVGGSMRLGMYSAASHELDLYLEQLMRDNSNEDEEED
jgi:hypothetical protein